MIDRWSLALPIALSLLPSCGGPPHDDCPEGGAGLAGCPSPAPPATCSDFSGIYRRGDTPVWRVEQQGCQLRGKPLDADSSATLSGVAFQQTAHAVEDVPSPAECPIHWELELTRLSESVINQRVVEGTGGDGTCRPPPDFSFTREPL